MYNDTVQYVFEGTGVVYEERINDGQNHCYIYAFGTCLARVDGTINSPASKNYYYHNYHLGSIKAVTDAQREVVWEYMDFVVK